ncbi:alpha/beta hydrolase [Oxynema sp. CENA135]|uniref:alpha/beta hydrolase n=1 Tax=Oxynema sp. CENA135 TaxID=984206 RepID=UPI00190DD1B5|nr:alpha/beta hydrolase [Oxynema sp. CENA135]MBK4728783.1 alpha/beta hydrolase [Oxynema sp. CENA135]
MSFPSRFDLGETIRKTSRILKSTSQKYFSILLALVLVSSTVFFFHTPSALAADEILLIYGSSSENVTLNELESFARTGQEPDVFRTRLGVTDQDASDLRTLLNQEIPVTRDFLERILQSSIGQYVLSRIEPVIGEEGLRQDVEDVTEALLRAADDGTIELLEVMRYYPVDRISVNGPLLAEAYNKISFIAEDVRPVIEVVSNFMYDLVCEGDFASDFDAPSLEAFSRASTSNLAWPN